ncbi:flagellar hook-length control protein FliK [Desulfoluna butyratoxydans]|uniref:Flagellar hook-length control protein-like c-terminal n=1 Tax=Desulfoluna butyratoxydans TaxID=231438 RepID=A0A4U8YNH4_9BACT|nr:flagellar hook-length control protein FliK [Desulfoluna butyratoxydans]VFQ42763.1 flagellar hook-length control protein-like c-terminal [Desulfoluna butyratoxydans]
MVSFFGFGSGKPAGPRPLAPGRVVRARVVQANPDGTATLKIGKREVEATVNQPMKSGALMRMRVTDVGTEHIALRRLTFANHPVGRYLVALRNLGRQGPFQHLFTLFGTDLPAKGATAATHLKEKLQRFVSQIAVKPGKSGVEDIRRMVRQSGLMHEHNLMQGGGEGEEDLKGLSLKLSRAVKREEPMGKAVKALIDGIEKLQVVNRATGEVSGRFLLPLPIVMDGNLSFGQLLIDRGEEGASGGDAKDRVTRVSMLLDLTRLGELRADISLLKGAVTGTFSVTTPEAEALLADDLEMLNHSLAERGFSVRKMNVQRVDRAVMAGTSLVDELVDAMDGLHVSI